MTHTRYTAGNIILLVFGIAICCFNTFLMSMMFGFGDIAQTGLQRLAISIAQWCIVFAVPAFLVAIRWCHVALFALWCLTLFSALFGLIGGLFSLFLMPLVLLVIASAIATSINSNSTKAMLSS
jgi:hypothetical protein